MLSGKRVLFGYQTQCHIFFVNVNAFKFYITPSNVQSVHCAIMYRKRFLFWSAVMRKAQQLISVGASTSKVPFLQSLSQFVYTTIHVSHKSNLLLSLLNHNLNVSFADETYLISAFLMPLYHQLPEHVLLLMVELSSSLYGQLVCLPLKHNNNYK